MSSQFIYNVYSKVLPFIKKHFTAESLALFSRDSEGYWIIANDEWERLPIREILKAFKDICLETETDEIEVFLPQILQAAKEDPKIGYEALSYSCTAASSIDVTFTLLCSGAPYKLPQSVSQETSDDKTAAMESEPEIEPPLVQAMRNPIFAQLLVLIGAGADVDEYLYTGSCPRYRPDAGEATRLHLAAIKNYAGAINVQMSKGIDIDAPDQHGATPLLRAAEIGSKNCVGVCLMHGGDINKADDQGRTPLTWAAANGHAEVVEQLLSMGAAVDIFDKDGYTPLHHAAMNDHRVAAAVFVIRGVDINQVDNIDGRTAISLAAERGLDAMIAFLIKFGADINEPSKNGRAPLSFALEKNATVAAEALRSAGRVRRKVYDSRKTSLDDIY